MRILIADDDQICLKMLEGILPEWGYEVVSAINGTMAWQILQEKEAPKLAILDWAMPGLDGLEVCRRVRQGETQTPAYMILLTARDAKADVVAGLAAGANDFVSKPFDREELRARIQVGQTVVELQANLADRVRQLEVSLAEVKQLKELLPICSYCRKLRDDNDYWHTLEAYLKKHANVRLSHSICPDCFREVMEREFGGSMASQGALP